MYMWSVLQFGLLVHLQNVKSTYRQPAACSLTENNPLWKCFLRFTMVPLVPNGKKFENMCSVSLFTIIWCCILNFFHKKFQRIYD